MSRRRRRDLPPLEPFVYTYGGIEELENELTVGRPLPPLVELLPPGSGPGVVNSAAGVPTTLTAPTRTEPTVIPHPTAALPRTAYLFPGQGAQAVGMAAALCQSLPAAKALFDEAAAVLGYDLLAICTSGPVERLNATDVSQPAIYVASLAALEQLKATEPDAANHVVATAGLSLGEYTALTFAGALPFADGLKVVQARGRAMQAAADATAGGMVSILGLEVPEVESLVGECRGDDTLQVANLLCPGNTVVSGSAVAVERLIALCETRGGIRTVKLAVAGAFHTPLMKPADDRLAEALNGISLTAPRVPVWSNVDAAPHTDPAEIRGLLVRQVVAPVRWEETTRALLAVGVERFYEIGPGRVLAGLLKRVHRKADVRNVAA